MVTGDTIVAVASATGPAARMIVRCSGPQSTPLAQALSPQTRTDGGAVSRVKLGFAGLAVPAWVYVFRGPRSYTGEDTVEFHLPGNPLLARMLVDELLGRGARPAEAGEFTARAYFNGRMDLAQAEGVAATIAAHGEAELAAARQLMSGELARQLRPITDALADTLALVEVGIDFSEEDVSFLSGPALRARVDAIDGELDRLVGQSARFERLAHEPVVVMVGRPNAGKSTLLNALSGEQRAVVSPVAGTTRDAIWAEVALQRGIIRLMDVAGLEDSPPDESDPSPAAGIARQMHSRALGELEAADVVMLVCDATDLRERLLLGPTPGIVVTTKSDLAPPGAPRAGLWVSAVSGENLGELRRQLDALCFGSHSGSAALALNSRHRRAIDEAREALSRAAGAVEGAGPEVVAMELREALDALGAVLGQITPDDVLGRVFSTFCIGK